MAWIKNVARSYLEKRKAAKELYGTKHNLEVLRIRVSQVYKKPHSEQVKDTYVKTFKRLSNSYKKKLKSDTNYPLPTPLNNKFLEDIEGIQIVSISDCQKFVDLALDIQNEKLKLYGPQINSFYTPIYAEGSLSLIEVSCLLILFFGTWGVYHLFVR
ncbi:hypothetical protein ACIQHV_28330 [Bacillus bombysepticus]|uniref:Uncharacterized protein n=1 Tax=Bacillus thuringiensis serovar kumamotoensis TaxID=132267 RepID=A0A9X6PN47_BACUK|nr:hypothetical protein [Bacillus thuringiensis]MEC2870069.1 hypothetical protein [Bacillus cereus]OTZ67104.1 hypothetical protein BK769_31120 [Bacillus thuringiensis serovar kumamtoensis]